MRTASAGGLYLIIALISLGLGSTYVFRGSFMPYHGQAVGLEWAEIDGASQTLYLALMDVAGAGWITLGLLTIGLLAWPFRKGEVWSRYLIPLAIFCFYVPTLLATLNVLWATSAATPWYGNATALAAAALAFIIDAPWRTDAARSEET